MASAHPGDAAQIAKLAAHMKWATCPDRAAATAAARQAFQDRFEREVDPDAKLDPVERAKRAASAKSAYYARMALKSAQSRRAKAAGRKLCPGAARCKPGRRCPEHHEDVDPPRAGEVFPEVVDTILDAGQESA